VEITLFYIPVGSPEEATRLGHLAIEQHLAACANSFPIQSTFPWVGEIQHEQEFVLILKTFPNLKEALREMISQSHSYEIPAILSWQAEVNDTYATWMKVQLGHS